MDKSKIIAELRQIQTELSEHISSLTPEQFEAEVGQSWSAAGYLKHLLLSNKPFVKGLSQPKERLEKLFGKTANGSRAYEELAASYQAALASGIKAEDYEAVTPVAYRLPEGIADEKAYFAATWNETHERLYTALDAWDEAELDQYQLPHPAIGIISMREMLYFTVFHNRLHWNDIQALP